MARRNPTSTEGASAPSASAPEATVQSASPTKAIVLVANQHTGAIILPRALVQGEQRIALPPLVLDPGTVTPVDGEEWSERKKMVVIQHYLDNRLLVEVQNEGQGGIMTAVSTDLTNAIPENLKTEAEIGASGAQASVTKEKSGEVQV